MDAPQPTLDAATHVWRLLATAFFVLANGFFVAGEFALVKVQAARLDALASEGRAPARVARHLLGRLDRYLSACQLGITLSSLILGWLAEPAIAELLLLGAGAVGVGIDPADPVLHAVALGVALAIVTLLHMTIGEQAPKIWALHRAEAMALRVAYPLRAFERVFRPFIWVVNEASNGLLRLAGMTPEQLQASSAHTPSELKHLLEASARSGLIGPRQLELTQNVLDMMALEVRHIMVPRVDVEYLTLQASVEETLAKVRSSGHSRLPLCAIGLDTVIGIVHAKEVMAAVMEQGSADLKRLARKPLYVADTQPVSRLIVQLQRTRNHCCVVLDEHGTTVGLAFLEDAIEEIVGPIQDEFDEAEPEIEELASGAREVPGSLALPEAAEELALSNLTEEADTIGGYVVAVLGRLPRKGDQLRVGSWRVTVTSVVRRRIDRLRFEPVASEGDSARS